MAYAYLYVVLCNIILTKYALFTYVIIYNDNYGDDVYTDLNLLQLAIQVMMKYDDDDDDVKYINIGMMM